jgi:hypothetical protein
MFAFGNLSYDMHVCRCVGRQGCGAYRGGVLIIPCQAGNRIVACEPKSGTCWRDNLMMQMSTY